MMLRQGQLNEETMDAEFSDWLFDYFRKLVQEKIVTVAGTELVTEITTGVDSADVLTDTLASATDSDNIYAQLEQAYQTFSTDLLAAVYGDADRDFMPTIYLPTASMQAYQIARGDKYTTTPEGIESGVVGNYMGMEVRHFSSLPANSILITPPRNLVMLTDSYNDSLSIQTEYDNKTNSRLVWGQFKLGFDFKNPLHLVYLATA